MKGYWFLQPVEGGMARGQIVSQITPKWYLCRFDLTTVKGPAQLNRVVGINEIALWTLFINAQAIQQYIELTQALKAPPTPPPNPPAAGPGASTDPPDAKPVH
jgi:hypothetical protein